MKPQRLSFRWKLRLSVAVVSMLIPALVIFWIYTRGRDLQMSALRTQLSTLAAVQAAALDSSSVRLLCAGEKDPRDIPEFKTIVDRFQQTIKANPRLKDVYIVRKTENPDCGVFVVSLDASAIGEDCEYAKYPDMKPGFEKPNADRELTRDKYGVWLSGYAPIRDEAGNTVALLGLDMPGDEVKQLQGEILWIALGGFFIAMILAQVVAYFASRWLSRPLEAFTDAMSKLADGDMKVRADIRSGDEFERMAQQFNGMVAGLAEREQMKAALMSAQQIQQNLLPKELPHVQGVEVAGRSDYCDETGGDYYDYWTMKDNDARMVLAGGDVAGHGIGSALLMAAARMDLRSLFSSRDKSLQIIFETLNNHLCRDVPSDKFLTLFFATIDMEKRKLRWISAGHDPALLFDPQSGKLQELKSTGLPLGVMEDSPYEEGESVDLVKGQVLAIGTDGIWEARNPQGELFGFDRFREIFRKHALLNTGELCNRIVEEVHAFRGSTQQLDDITLVLAKITS